MKRQLTKKKSLCDLSMTIHADNMWRILLPFVYKSPLFVKVKIGVEEFLVFDLYEKDGLIRWCCVNTGDIETNMVAISIDTDVSFLFRSYNLF